jgi:hypothetical protein
LANLDGLTLQGGGRRLAKFGGQAGGKGARAARGGREGAGGDDAEYFG